MSRMLEMDRWGYLPDPLPVPVTKGKRGPWQIDTFTLTEQNVLMGNLRALRDGDHWLLCKPGTYTRLHHERRGVVMSNTAMEVRTNSAFIKVATGRVLVNGLGLGMPLRAVLDKPDVTFVRVFEIDADVIALVGPGFRKDVKAGRLEIVQGDCFAYKPQDDETYDCAWHDVWDAIQHKNLKEMAALRRKWAKRVPVQMCWCHMQCRKAG